MKLLDNLSFQCGKKKPLVINYLILYKISMILNIFTLHRHHLQNTVQFFDWHHHEIVNGFQCIKFHLNKQNKIEKNVQNNTDIINITQNSFDSILI